MAYVFNTPDTVPRDYLVLPQTHVRSIQRLSVIILVNWLMEPPSTAEKIMDVAERMARTGGYNAFSFREIAKEIGIKSASVHYHFPDKEELGSALARRYTGRFMESLGPVEDGQLTSDEMINRFIEAYSRAAASDGQMCLCGIFGAQINHLPTGVAAEVQRFFQLNLDWLTQAIVRKSPPPSEDAARDRARHILATLEGALILSRSLEDPAIFDSAATPLV